MQYSLICFTFNKRPKEVFPEESPKLVLRNNWTEEVKDINHLSEALFALGFQGQMPDIRDNTITKLSSDFTVPNTVIIVHIVKNF